MKEPRKDEQSRIIHVPMGQSYLSNEANDVLAIFGLGSCIGLVLYEPFARIGSLCHIVLPNMHNGFEANPARAADSCVPFSLDKMIKAGANPKYIWGKIVGGAAILSERELSIGSAIGTQNIHSVKKALDIAGVKVMGEEVGGRLSRKLWFYVGDGRVEVRRLGKPVEKL